MKYIITAFMVLVFSCAIYSHEDEMNPGIENIPVNGGLNRGADEKSNEPVNLKLVMKIKFIEKTFVEIYCDNNRKIKGFMPAGTEVTWEANESIRFKCGNAGGIKVQINGKEYRFGRIREVAQKVITLKKNTDNPAIYNVEINEW